MMGKYRDLINCLTAGGEAWKANYEALVKADGRAFRPAAKALLEPPTDDVREDCAEILGKRGSPRAIPYLIEALRDPCLFVRHDALWSIEEICLYQPCALCDWLDVGFDNPRDLYRKVKGWWRRNRQYREGNEAWE